MDQQIVTPLVLVSIPRDILIYCSRLDHFKNTSSGLFICSVSLGWLSIINCTRPSLACSIVPPDGITGLTVQAWKSVAITVTNSTWDIFWPGHTRGPPDQARKIPRSGVLNSACPTSLSPLNHREGLNIVESAPQNEGLVCRQALFTYTVHGPLI